MEKNMKRKIISIYVFLMLVLTAFAIIPSNVSAVTPEEIQQSIEDGIAWLITQQDGWGKWQDVPRTAFVLIKLQDRAYELGLDPFETNSGEPDYYEYATNVIDGWEYLLTPGGSIGAYAWKHTISVQPAGNPDSNGNGYGISFQNSGYYTGIGLMALAATGAASRPNDGGLDFDLDGDADTYGEIAQEVVDFLAYGQVDSGNQRGSWGYGANYGGDNSVSGYAVLGLAAAEGFGCTIPAFVKPELSIFINNVQDVVNGDTHDGGSWYRAYVQHWVNMLKTGNLIFEMTFVGDAITTPRFQDAMDYIYRHWQDVNRDPGWGYSLSPAHYQAMYCLMKGLEYSGINLIDHDDDGTIDHDWYQEFATVLVNQQHSDGYWPSVPCYVWPSGFPGTQSGTILATVWNLLNLEKVTPPPPMTIDKTLSASEGELGDTITVTINVNNPNGYTVVVDDTLPKSVHYVKNTFTLDGISVKPKVIKNYISITIEETGPHIIEFDIKIDEAKSWEDWEVCNVVEATWYEDGVEIETKEDIECFTILAFEELHKNVGIPKADVVFAIDLSGSMWTEIDVIQSQAATIINNIQSSVGDVQFGLMTFMDYVGTYTTTSTVPGAVPTTYTGTYGSAGWSDYPYKLDQDIGSAASVITAIGLMPDGNGMDWPQDYSRILHESYNDPALTWRPGATRFLILFGDAWPHDTGFDYNNDGTPDNAGGDPGRDTILGNADDLDFETEVANAAANGVRVLSVYSGGDSSRFPWTYMATQTGGQYFKLTEAGQIPGAIKDLLKAEAQETLTVSVGEDVQWAIVMDIVNTFSYTMEDTIIKDNFGAEIELDDFDSSKPEIDEVLITHGTWSYRLKGKSQKVSLHWDIGDLLPTETARLVLLVSTDKNPAGHQEYSSPGVYELNSGATLKFIDPEQEVQLSAYTDSILVTAEENPDKKLLVVNEPETYLPKAKTVQYPIIQENFHRFPRAFPILRYLLGL
jgi:uncharacterized repeat protein (TIGR01451 family)